MGTVAWFGRHLDAPAYDEAPQIPVPVGEDCLGCGEPIEEGDDGITMPYVTEGFEIKRAPYHTECELRSMLGGIAHQEKRCSCFGGTDDDHDGRSREDARAVLAWYLDHGSRWADT